jgi:hypothetical protein
VLNWPKPTDKDMQKLESKLKVKIYLEHSLTPCFNKQNRLYRRSNDRPLKNLPIASKNQSIQQNITWKNNVMGILNL